MMGQVSAKLRLVQNGGLMYWCQGCAERHIVRTGAGDGPRWGFNGDFAAPTFTPSVLITWRDPDGQIPDEVCHTFITAGMVQFLGDCTHALAGQTLELPDLPPELRDA